jgi:hypothetical protein
MLRNRASVPLVVSFAVFLSAAACSGSKSYVASNDDRAALEKTSAAIRDAFARGDAATILAFHYSPTGWASIRELIQPAP